MNLEKLSIKELIAIIQRQRGELDAKDRELNRKKRILDDKKDRELDAKDRELIDKDREVKRLKLYQFHSVSHAAVYERFDREATKIDTFPSFFTAPEPSDDLVLSAWEYLKAEFPPKWVGCDQ
jgi:hypothetical protein